jgi:ABC-2 type transport system permease protein
VNRATWAVVKREYLQRVRTKWFILSTVLAPVILSAIILFPILMAADDGQTERRLTVVDSTGVLFDAVAPRLTAGGYTVADGSGEDPAALLRSVEGGRLGGYLVLTDASLTRGEARLVSLSPLPPVETLLLRQAVVQGALAIRLGGVDEDVMSLLSGGALEVELLARERRGAQEPRFVAAYAGTFLLYTVLVLYAVAVQRSVLEEKTSRIVEVIISSIRPFELMLGKILGVGAVGLTQLLIWGAVGTLLVTLGVPALLAARPELISPELISEALPGAGFGALFAVFFLGGYFIYSGLYAAVGATCSTDEEAQQAQFPVVALLLLPVIILPAVLRDPEATRWVAMSLVPFFSPILMFGRAAMGAATPAEIGLSVVLMAATVVAVAWLAGRIYRVGILMTGKRPTLPEILRWVRES